MKIVFPKRFPTLETERLVLRNLTTEDREGVFRNFSDEEVTKYLMSPFTDIVQAEDIIKAFMEEFEQGSALTWAITLKAGGEFLGTCSCEINSGDRAELGFDLARSHWGKGLMSETLQSVIRFCFERMEFKQIKAHTNLLNHQTIRLLKKLDFNLDGILSNNSFINGEFHDEIFFSLWKANWQNYQGGNKG